MPDSLLVLSVRKSGKLSKLFQFLTQKFWALLSRESLLRLSSKFHYLFWRSLPGPSSRRWPNRYFKSVSPGRFHQVSSSKSVPLNSKLSRYRFRFDPVIGSQCVNDRSHFDEVSTLKDFGKIRTTYEILIFRFRMDLAIRWSWFTAVTISEVPFNFLTS